MKKSTKRKMVIGYNIGCMVIQAAIIGTCLTLAAIVAVRG